MVVVSSRVIVNGLDVLLGWKFPEPAKLAVTVVEPGTWLSIIGGEHEATPAAFVTPLQFCAPMVNLMVWPATGAEVPLRVSVAEVAAGSWKSAEVAPVYVSLVGVELTTKELKKLLTTLLPKVVPDGDTPDANTVYRRPSRQALPL